MRRVLGGESYSILRPLPMPPGDHWRQPSISMCSSFECSAGPSQPSTCRHVYRRDCSVRPNTPPHSLSSVARGTEKSVAQHDQTTGISPSAPHPHHPQCGSGRPEPTRAPQYRVDAASRGLRNSLLGGPLQVDLLASPTNYRLPQWVSLSSPGCSGLQLSKFRLERL